MTVSVGDILRVVATLYWLDGEIMQNVFNAQIIGSGGPYDNSDIVDDAVEWLDDMYANLTVKITEELNGSSATVYVYDSGDDDWDEIGTGSWSFNPSQSDGYLPKGVAGLINVSTIDADVNGKKYIGGFTELSVSDGLWGGSDVTALLAFGADWILDFVGGTTGADWEPGVWSPTNLDIYPMGGAVSVPTIPAYQRRRKDNVGV